MHCERLFCGCEPITFNNNIVVCYGNVFSVGHTDTATDRASTSARILPHIPKSSAAEGVHYFSRFIVGTLVNDNHFKVYSVVGQNGFDSTAELVRTSDGWNHNAELRCGFHRPASASLRSTRIGRDTCSASVFWRSRKRILTPSRLLSSS